MVKSIVGKMLLILLLGYLIGCSKDGIDIKDPIENRNYFVATNGNDTNPGTFDSPWATWGKAFTSVSVKAGDTVFFRGGVSWSCNWRFQ